MLEFEVGNDSVCLHVVWVVQVTCYMCGIVYDVHCMCAVYLCDVYHVCSPCSMCTLYKLGCCVYYVCALCVM
jgi:hypothetical protein